MSVKFCPACKLPNKSDATVCIHCEAPLEHGPGDTPTTVRMGGNAIQPSKMTEADIRDLEIPKQGIALYLEDSIQPIATLTSREFMIGRKKFETVSEDFVDLIPFGGHENGVSQRHALVRKTDSGYEIIDLDSTNGTWLNRMRLIPNQAYTLQSGAQICLGRLRLYLIFNF